MVGAVRVHGGLSDEVVGCNFSLSGVVNFEAVVVFKRNWERVRVPIPTGLGRASEVEDTLDLEDPERRPESRGGGIPLVPGLS